MMRRLISDQRGSEKIYSVMGVAAILIIGYLLIALSVPFFKNISLEGYAQKLVNYDYQNELPNPNGVKSIYNKLLSYTKQKNLPVPETQISVDYDAKKYYCKIEYQHRVNLIVYSFDWKFDVRKETMDSY